MFDDGNRIEMQGEYQMETFINNKVSFPKVGRRIVKSVIAVFLCFVIYFLRGQKGIPFYSALAALQCIQPYMKNTAEVGRGRFLGTLVGSFWGLVVLLIGVYLFHDSTYLLYFLIMSVFTGVTLYSAVLLKLKDVAYFSTVVFLSIAAIHIDDVNPYLFVLDRILDTSIGIVLALALNASFRPKGKNKHTLYISGVDDVMLDWKGTISSYTKIELNRMIDAGVNFTVSTMKTPAALLESLDGLQLKLPVIIMDGAAMYDWNEKVYLHSFPMSHLQERKIMNILNQEEVNYFTNVIIENTLFIYYQELHNDAEKDVFNKMHKSVYRNYLKRSLPENEEVTYFMLLQESKVIEQIYNRLMNQNFIDAYKVIRYLSNDYPGYAYLKIYAKEATRDHMLEELLKKVGLKESFLIGSIPGKCDLLITDSRNDSMVKKLKTII